MIRDAEERLTNAHASADHPLSGPILARSGNGRGHHLRCNRCFQFVLLDLPW